MAGKLRKTKNLQENPKINDNIYLEECLISFSNPIWNFQRIPRCFSKKHQKIILKLNANKKAHGKLQESYQKQT